MKKCYQYFLQADSHSEFLNETEIILGKLCSYKADNKIIASDFNFGNTYCKLPILPPKPLDRHAPDLFSSFGFSQLIDIPTRVTRDTTSLVDLIFTSNSDYLQSFGTLAKIADHDGTFVSFHCQRNKSKNITKTIYDFKNIDETGLINFIKDFDFENLVFTKPAKEQATIMSSFLSETVSKFVPTKKDSVRDSDQPWTNSYTRLLLRKKNRNYNFFKRSNAQFLLACSQGLPVETITRLKLKKDKAFEKCKTSDKESFKSNRRAKQAFFNSVNATMGNYENLQKRNVIFYPN